MIDSWKVVEQFEARMAEYCGAPHAVAVDTCTAALFLCFKRSGAKKIRIPRYTYLGVACAAIHAGAEVEFSGHPWRGMYPIDVLGGPAIFDSACAMYRGMVDGIMGYYGNHGAGIHNTCLSFQSRKHLKIGRGGMILTASAEDAAWFRKARFCGRAEHNGKPEFVGWHCFMEPERAARGLVLMDSLPDRNDDLVFEYPDLRDYPCLRS